MCRSVESGQRPEVRAQPQSGQRPTPSIAETPSGNTQELPEPSGNTRTWETRTKGEARTKGPVKDKDESRKDEEASLQNSQCLTCTGMPRRRRHRIRKSNPPS